MHCIRGSWYNETATCLKRLWTQRHKMYIWSIVPCLRNPTDTYIYLTKAQYVGHSLQERDKRIWMCNVFSLGSLNGSYSIERHVSLFCINRALNTHSVYFYFLKLWHKYRAYLYIYIRYGSMAASIFGRCKTPTAISKQANAHVLLYLYAVGR